MMVSFIPPCVAVQTPEIAHMIRVVATYETRELAVLWGRSLDDVGVAAVLDVALVLFHVTDLLAFGAFGDPERLRVMAEIRDGLRSQLAGDDPERFDEVFSDPGRVYDDCRSVAGDDDGIVPAGALQLAATYGDASRELASQETAKALVQITVALLATPAYAPLTRH